MKTTSINRIQTNPNPGTSAEKTNRKKGEGPVWQGGQAEAFVTRKLISRDELRAFARPNVWRWLLAVAGEWLVIAITITICNFFPNLLVWALGVFIIGTRQHALGIMAHESTHYLVSRNRRLNDLLGNLLAAYPLTYAIEGYRTNHLEHHRWLETPKDPEQAALRLYPEEWSYPMSRTKFFGLLAKDMLGGSLKPMSELTKYIWTMPGKSIWPHVAAVIAMQAIAFFAFFYAGLVWSYLLLWLLPLSTVALMCFRLRTVAEHSGVHAAGTRYSQTRADTLATTRTTVYGPVLKFLFGPHNMAYHIEHHAFPNVPVFRLKALHERLMQSAGFQERAHVSYGGGALLSELTNVPEKN